MNEKNLISGFSEEDAKRISLHLRKLIPHLKDGKFVFVGGLAIRYHLEQHKIEYPIRSFNDLDIIAEHLSVVLPSVTRDFLISHYHSQTGNNFYIVLIDPETKTKVDVFDYEMAPRRTVSVMFDGNPVRVVSIEDQLVKTVFDIQRISSQARVDPKQFLDAELLSKIADMEYADRVWQGRNFNQFPPKITQAIERATQIAQEHPEWVQEKPFYKPRPYKCHDCVPSPQFPITPMGYIYKVMGYIE